MRLFTSSPMSASFLTTGPTRNDTTKNTARTSNGEQIPLSHVDDVINGEHR